MLPKRKQELSQLITNFQPKKLMVIGDIMLDKYTWGRVERISPEAPIPVLKVEKEEFRLGGSASVVANVRALDCDVVAIGCIGDDEAGRQVKDIFQDNQISTNHLLVTNDRPTTQKDRALTSQQQLLRVDYEKDWEYSASIEQGLIQTALQEMGKVDAVILSDYAKGVLNEKLCKEVIREAKKYNIPVICDPGKGADYSMYQGVTTIKPNRTEAEQATGIKLKDKQSILKAAQRIQDTVQAEFLSLSLDKDGILLYYSADHYQFIETDVIEVFDVTGAGDMVVTMISTMLTQKVEPKLAIAMANLAAEIEISHMGVVALPWKDISDFLHQDELTDKIKTLAELKAELQKEESYPKLVFSNGYFDNLSAGHLRFILEIGKIPGRLILAINSDKSIAKEKGNPPLLKQKDRARLLASLESVYRVVIFDEDNASHLIKEIQPRVVVKGEKFKGEQIPEQAAIAKVGATIEYITNFHWS